MTSWKNNHLSRCNFLFYLHRGHSACTRWLVRIGFAKFAQGFSYIPKQSVRTFLEATRKMTYSTYKGT